MNKHVEITTKGGKWFRLFIYLYTSNDLDIHEAEYEGVFCLPYTPIGEDIDLDNHVSRDYESKPIFHFTRPLRQVLTELQIPEEMFQDAVKKARANYVKEML